MPPISRDPESHEAMKNLALTLTTSAALLFAGAAYAGPVTGAAIGAGTGAVVAGPPGAVVGGVIGAVVGGPNIHYYHHYRIRTDARGRNYYVRYGHRHYI